VRLRWHLLGLIVAAVVPVLLFSAAMIYKVADQQRAQLKSEIGDVTEVLANGNLLVRGEKLIGINQGHEYVRLSGIVRAQDIQPDNSVLSTQVADAQISYGGKGALADSNEHGWLTRFFVSSWWPF